MNKVTTAFTVLALGLGLAACDNQEQSETADIPQEAQSPVVERESPTQEDPRTEAVPAEPLDPPATTPSEPPDPGTHGINEGTLVPDDAGSGTGTGTGTGIGSGSGDTEVMEVPITEPGGQQPQQTEPPSAPPTQP